MSNVKNKITDPLSDIRLLLGKNIKRQKCFNIRHKIKIQKQNIIQKQINSINSAKNNARINLIPQVLM